MTENQLKWSGFFVAVTGVVGLVLIFFSVDFGTSLAESWLVNQDGFSSTELYHIILESYINSFLITGSILLGLSFLFAIVAYFAFMLLPKR
ncbi:hypothetical protein EDD69_1245 [Thermolongibacillus altinsuensis]|uniref:YfzA-like protein n=1 Tax=Thermolongibacillus altinsuensis TaxID=575256 RepID=A0A4R1Q878_9BACL|nr:hypothetical protein [Thermolongibacillus altinsuensis]TCL44279.1 hypothetical protein EDD69_1245 [Thermolongibacillus altinsuensis]